MDPVDLRTDVQKGLAYEKEFPINWCPSCKTGLANEEVVKRLLRALRYTGYKKKNLRQWMLKITASQIVS